MRDLNWGYTRFGKTTLVKLRANLNKRDVDFLSKEFLLINLLTLELNLNLLYYLIK